MPHPTTAVSTRDQVILRKAVRDALNWQPETRRVVENRPAGVFLRAVKESPFPPTTIEVVFGSVKNTGPTVTLADLEQAIRGEISERARRGRYDPLPAQTAAQDAPNNDIGPRVKPGRD
jgi:bifunctional DNA-binding transcriptional regulator/antitoxin component of YhaV-PrlF toxin-antitoxin module